MDLKAVLMPCENFSLLNFISYTSSLDCFLNSLIYVPLNSLQLMYFFQLKPC